MKILSVILFLAGLTLAISSTVAFVVCIYPPGGINNTAVIALNSICLLLFVASATAKYISTD